MIKMQVLVILTFLDPGAWLFRNYPQVDILKSWILLDLHFWVCIYVNSKNIERHAFVWKLAKQKRSLSDLHLKPLSMDNIFFLICTSVLLCCNYLIRGAYYVRALVKHATRKEVWSSAVLHVLHLNPKNVKNRRCTVILRIMINIIQASTNAFCILCTMYLHNILNRRHGSMFLKCTLNLDVIRNNGK